MTSKRPRGTDASLDLDSVMAMTKESLEALSTTLALRQDNAYQAIRELRTTLETHLPRVLHDVERDEGGEGTPSHRNRCDVPRDEDILALIRQELRKRVPFDGYAPGETVVPPEVGHFAEYQPYNTVHVDAFLYEDDASVDDLCESGQISRFYCVDCHSHNIRPMNFISHSASMVDVRRMFEVMLGDLRGKSVVDIGSRLGPIVYGAYLFSDATEIFGIEENSFFVTLQKDMIRQFRMGDRARIIHADVMDCGDILQRADVVVLHNVFEFFHSHAEQQSLWEGIRSFVTRPGCRVIALPSLEECLQYQHVDLDMAAWVHPIAPPAHLHEEGSMAWVWQEEGDEDDEAHPMYLYEVAGA